MEKMIISTEEHSNMLSIIAIIANRGGCTIRELNKITNIPVEILKNNLEYIENNPELYFKYSVYLHTEEEDYRDNEWRVIEDLHGHYLLNLNSFEKYFIDMICSLREEKNKFDIKTKKNYNTNEYDEKIEKILIAIKSKKILKIKYRQTTGETSHIKLEPLAVVFYEFSSVFYVLGQGDDKLITYNMDRIFEIQETNEIYKRNIDINIEEYLANRWGMEQGEELYIKVKFMKEANVERKVKRELECRKNKTIEDFPDHFIYSDKVIGKNSFKHWILGYGSSAIVLEPQELRDAIMDSAKKALNLYKN